MNPPKEKKRYFSDIDSNNPHAQSISKLHFKRFAANTGIKWSSYGNWKVPRMPRFPQAMVAFSPLTKAGLTPFGGKALALGGVSFGAWCPHDSRKRLATKGGKRGLFEVLLKNPSRINSHGELAGWKISIFLRANLHRRYIDSFMLVFPWSCLFLFGGVYNSTSSWTKISYLEVQDT